MKRGGAVLALLLAAVAAPGREPPPADPDLLSARQRLARDLLVQGRETEAIVELRAAALVGPLERDLALKLAQTELSQGNEAAAEVQLESLVERFDSVQAMLHLARLRSSHGGEGAALGLLRRALALAPSSEEVLSAVARTALDSREPATAIPVLQPLVRMQPEVAEYAYLLGVAWLQVGDFPAALEPLERAAELEPDRPLTLIALGMALNHQKRYGPAREALTESLRLEPGHLEAVAALAESEQGLGELDEAERHARRVLSEDPRHATANLVLGMIRMEQGRLAEARDALVQAVEAEPDSPKAQYQLSQAYARLGDDEGFRRHQVLYDRARREAEQRLIEQRAPAALDDGGGE